MVPAAARAFYHLIDKYFRSNDALLLSVIQRLLPADARVEQLLGHELPLVISAHELLGDVDPLLQTPSVVVKGPYESPTEYFDANFRLMRHEGFGELRNGISSLLRGKLDVRDMNVYKDVAVHGVRFGISANEAMTISLVCTPLKRLGKASEIMYGNLLCMSLDGSFKDPIWAVVAHCEASAKETTAHVRLCLSTTSTTTLPAPLPRGAGPR